MDNSQISTDFPIMCFFVFELLTEAGEELIRGIAFFFGARLFSVHELSPFDVFNFKTRRSPSLGKKKTEATSKSTRRVFQNFVGRGGPNIVFVSFFTFLDICW